jgi:hypothetical protein
MASLPAPHEEQLALEPLHADAVLAELADKQNDPTSMSTNVSTEQFLPMPTQQYLPMSVQSNVYQCEYTTMSILPCQLPTMSILPMSTANNVNPTMSTANNVDPTGVYC